MQANKSIALNDLATPLLLPNFIIGGYTGGSTGVGVINFYNYIITSCNRDFLIVVIHPIYNIYFVLDQMSLANSRKYDVKEYRNKGINCMQQRTDLRTIFICSRP